MSSVGKPGVHMRHHSDAPTPGDSSLAVEFYTSPTQDGCRSDGGHPSMLRSSLQSTPPGSGPGGVPAGAGGVLGMATSNTGSGAAGGGIDWFGFDDQQPVGHSLDAAGAPGRVQERRESTKDLRKGKADCVTGAGGASTSERNGGLFSKLKKSFLPGKGKHERQQEARPVQRQVEANRSAHGPAPAVPASPTLPAPPTKASLGPCSPVSSCGEASTSRSSASPSSTSASGPLFPPSISGPLPVDAQLGMASGPLPLDRGVGVGYPGGSISGPLGKLSQPPNAGQNDAQTLIGIAPGASPAALQAYLQAKAARQQRAGKRVVKVVEVSMER